MESHEAGFPPFPHLLEIPSGFPHSQGFGDEEVIFCKTEASNLGLRVALQNATNQALRDSDVWPMVPLVREADFVDKWITSGLATIQELRVSNLHRGVTRYQSRSKSVDSGSNSGAKA
jgi:hypothetical protein